MRVKAGASASPYHSLPPSLPPEVESLTYSELLDLIYKNKKNKNIGGVYVRADELLTDWV